MRTKQQWPQSRPTRRARTLTATVLSACMLATSVSACGTSGDGDSTSTLVVGSDLTAPPYSSLKDGKPVGFDPEMATRLAETMGRKVSIKDTRFEQLIPSLKAGQINLIASDLYITKERSATVDYIPYFSTGNSIVVGADDTPITDAMGLCGRKVAVIQGGAIVKSLRSDASAKCTRAGKHEIELREFSKDPEGAQAVVAGQVDALVTDAAICAEISKAFNGKVVVSSHDLLYPVPVGLAVKKGNDTLRKAVVEALDKLKKSGEYAKLLHEYNLRPVDEQRVASILGR
ncbi:ABC transporter substrate-binding protein [Spirillospora sp. NPDC047418]